MHYRWTSVVCVINPHCTNTPLQQRSVWLPSLHVWKQNLFQQRKKVEGVQSTGPVVCVWREDIREYVAIISRFMEVKHWRVCFWASVTWISRSGMWRYKSSWEREDEDTLTHTPPDNGSGSHKDQKSKPRVLSVFKGTPDQNCVGVSDWIMIWYYHWYGNVWTVLAVPMWNWPHKHLY